MATKPIARIPQELKMANAIPVSTQKDEVPATMVTTAVVAVIDPAVITPAPLATPVSPVAPVVVDSVAPTQPTVKPPKSVEDHFSGAKIVNY